MNAVKIYKIQVDSGRLLGPLTLNQIIPFIQQNHIHTSTLIRVQQEGTWKEARLIPEIADLLVLHSQGKLQPQNVLQSGPSSSPQKTQILPSPGSQTWLPSASEEKTTLISLEAEKQVPFLEKTSFIDPVVKSSEHEGDKTVFLSKPPPLQKKKKPFLYLAIMGSLGIFFFLDEFSQSPPLQELKPIKIKMPSFIHPEKNPKKSEQLYHEGILFYFEDTIPGYYQAAEKFSQSAEADKNNVKALAMLAATYMNLADSSLQDETYFAVLTQLIDLSKAKDLDLLETNLAEIEFFVLTKQWEAAKNKIVEYTKNHSHYGFEMFYYMGFIASLEEDFMSAAKYLNQIQGEKGLSPKYFYLKGLVAEKLKDFEAAGKEYQKALALYPKHAKSHLRLALLSKELGRMEDAYSHIQFLSQNPSFLSQTEKSLSFWMQASYWMAQEKWKAADSALKQAVDLEPENTQYLLEWYTNQARIQSLSEPMKKKARMSFFLGEGEQLEKQGKYQEAIISFLEARRTLPDSFLPLVKLGNLFLKLNQLEDAKMNYRLAAEKEKKNSSVWSKYIQLLIETYDWDEGQKAITHLQSVPSLRQSLLNKLKADFLFKQGHFLEAQNFYKKAMSEDYVEPAVYLSYGKTLMALKKFKEAIFFFSLALRFDPFSLEAIFLTAQCLSETESIEKGIEFLQNELKKSKQYEAEFLSAIAELELRRGNTQEALEKTKEAIRIKPDYSYSWKMKAKIEGVKNGENLKGLNQTLQSYQDYLNRNPSDPSAYLERYKIFSKRYQFDKAKEELNKIYSFFPKYPALHYYMGLLYAAQGNHPEAIRELKLELSQNPQHLLSLVALGREFLEIKNNEAALQAFSDAMKTDQKNAEAKQLAGWTHFLLKNYQSSLTLLKLAASLDPANPLIFKRLGLVSREIGDEKNACQFFKKYLETDPEAVDRPQYASCFSAN